MKVDIQITKNCTLVATGIDESREIYEDYVRAQDLAFNMLIPCSAEINDLKNQINEILEPCPSKYDGKVVYLELVTNKDGIKDSVVSDNIENEYNYKLKKDGLYVYYKIMMYKKAYIDDSYENKFYYDEESDKIYFGNNEVKDFSEVLDLFKTNNYGIIDYFEFPIFSICHLRNCLSELQRKVIFSGIKDCAASSSNCEKNKTYKSQRDFLFITLQILEQLICLERYDEAEEILEAISTCGSICSELVDKTNGCNCNNN